MVRATMKCSPALPCSLHYLLRSFYIVLLLLPSILCEGVEAQAPPVVGDTARVRTPLAVAVGRVEYVCADSLIISHTDPRFPTPMTVTPTMMLKLQVKAAPLGARERALRGAGGGALFTGIWLAALAVAGGRHADWRHFNASDPFYEAALVGPTVAGAAIGLMQRSHWRDAALPRRDTR